MPVRLDIIPATVTVAKINNPTGVCAAENCTNRPAWSLVLDGAYLHICGRHLTGALDAYFEGKIDAWD